MKNLELYIENYLVDLDEDVKIVLTRQINDILDPGKIKNDFTKTVSLPSTINNNRLFGYIYSPNKDIVYGTTNIGINFNPSKKAYFKLFINSQLIYSGYIKLLNINYINIYKWRYEITLYGNLGDFFQQFGDSSLREVLESNPSYTDNYVQYSSVFPLYDGKNYSLMNLWDARKSGTTNREYLSLTDLYNNDYSVSSIFEGNNRNIYFDLIDAENGLYDDGKKIIHSGAFKTSFETSFTEQQVCLKNEVQQRLGLYNDKLIFDIVSGIGYTITNIDGEWINKDNPYWYNTLTSTITPKTIEENYFLNASGNTYTFNIYSSTSYKYNYYVPKVSNITSDPNWSFSELTGKTWYANNMPLDGYYKYTPIQVTDIYPNKFDITFTDDPSYYYNAQGGFDVGDDYWYPENNTSESEWIKIMTNWIIADNSQTYQNSFVDKTITLTCSHFIDNEQNYYYFRITFFDAPFRIQIRIEDTGEWMFLEDFLSYKYSTQISKNPYYNIENVGIVFNIQTSKRSGVRMGQHYMLPEHRYINMSDVSVFRNTLVSDFTFDIKSVKDVGYFSKVKYIEYLPKVKASDFFINYIKMFGLYLDVNNDDKTIQILTRNEFYSGYTVEDWTTKLDTDSDFEMTPLNFSNKYIRLGYVEGDTNVCKNYKNKYNKSYGEQILNTGYEFNETTYDYLDKNIYSNYASVAQEYDIYGFNPDPKVVPALYQDSLEKSKASEKLFITFTSDYNSTTDRDYKLPYFISGVTDGMYFGFYNKGVYQLHYTIKNIDGYNIYQSNVNSDSEGYIILTTNIGGQPFGSYGPLVNEPYNYIPTNHYYPNVSDIQYSLDFGRPMEQYHNGVYNSGTTIYDRLFKKYLEDRYDVNTKILKAKFYLNDTDIANFKFNKFIYLFDKYWTVNKIEDYNLISDELTEVELVSVNDIGNYTTGQFL